MPAGEATTQRPNESLIGGAVRAVLAAVAALAGFSLVINLLMLTGPLFMLQIYDRVLPAYSVPTLVSMAILVAVLYVFLGILEAIRSRVLSRIARRIDEQLEQRSFDVTVLLPTIGGALAERAVPTRDLETVRHFLAGPGPTAVFDMPWMPIYLAIIYLLHPVLGLVATGAALVIVVLALANELSIRRPTRASMASNTRALALIEDARRSSEVAGTMGMLGNLRTVWAAHRHAYLDSTQSAGDRAGGFSATIKAARFAFQSAVLGVGAYLAIHQVVSPGAMIAASIIMSRALAPVDQAVAHWRGFAGARQSLRRLRRVLEIDAGPADRTELPRPERAMAVADLAVAPPGTPTPTLQRASFALEAGEGLGVIGPSGSGKSTLARTIVGVWQPVRGSVRLDGAELSQFCEPARAAHTGYLPQEVALFDGTVAQNIARFDPAAVSEDIVAAARLAGAHDLIVTLPDGYETRIGEGGSALSAGQRQRIALARAVFGDPFLVVLDEPNSNLDADGEQALSRAVAELRKRGAIVVVVAHRASAIAHVNKILVLNGGVQTAFGPKDEVLAQALQPVRNERDRKSA